MAGMTYTFSLRTLIFELIFHKGLGYTAQSRLLVLSYRLLFLSP